MICPAFMRGWSRACRARAWSPAALNDCDDDDDDAAADDADVMIAVARDFANNTPLSYHDTKQITTTSI